MDDVINTSIKNNFRKKAILKNIKKFKNTIMG